MKMIKLQFFIALLFCCQVIYGQVSVHTFAKEIQLKNLKRHVSILASDSCAGRGISTKGITIARNYIQKQWNSVGFNNTDRKLYLQEFKLLNSRKIEMLFKTSETSFSMMKDFRYYGEYDNFNAQMPVLFAGYSDFDKIDKAEIKGKAVLILKDNLWASFKEAKKAYKKGAAISFIANPKIPTQFSAISHQLLNLYNCPRYKLLKERSSFVDTMKNRFCEVSSSCVKKITNRSLNYWYNKAKKKNGIGSEIGSVKIFAKEIEKDTIAAYNVISTIPGIKKDEYIVIGAHYDHLGVINGDIYRGADDNASGVSALIEIAKTFAKAYEKNYRPKRTILFVAFSGEEGGMCGSEYFVNHFENINQVQLMLNIDMIGRTNSKHFVNKNSFYLIKHNLSDSIALQNDKICKRYRLSADYSSSVNSSDSKPFTEKGIATIFYYSGKHEDYHKPSDIVSKINYNKLTKIARLIFETAWQNAQITEL